MMNNNILYYNMYISGSVGFTLLKHVINSKCILLLADIHDGVSYCERDSIMIDKYLDLKSANYDILLEEVVRDKKLTLKELWPNAIHTQRLKELNAINHMIKPIDIRPLLLPFSWELYEVISEEQANTTLKEYITGIDACMNLKHTNLFINYILPEVKKLTKEPIRVILIIHFDEIKEIFNEFKIKYSAMMDMKIIDLVKINTEIFERINNILSMLMEWYILVICHNSNINTIIHIGLAHSSRILELLCDVYSYKIITQKGITKIDAIIASRPSACIFMPDNMEHIEVINKKYLFG